MCYKEKDKSNAKYPSRPKTLFPILHASIIRERLWRGSSKKILHYFLMSILKEKEATNRKSKRGRKLPELK